MSDELETTKTAPKFDFSAYPPDTFFHERRTGFDRRAREGEIETAKATPPGERRKRPDRRRRVDPTTFEKQYSPAELEFMSAIQRFKVRTGKTFPTHREVLQIALELGYRKRALIAGNEPGHKEV